MVASDLPNFRVTCHLALAFSSRAGILVSEVLVLCLRRLRRKCTKFKFSRQSYYMPSHFFSHHFGRFAMAQAFTEMTPPQLGEEGTVPLPGSPRRGKNKKRDAAALRKAPQAPKRFKSSYICFFMAKQPDIKEELGDKATVTEISKRSAEMWRNLPGKERQHWEEVAAKDKQRYMMEKQSYTGPWQVPWKRARKDPSAPKRPMSAFLYFSQGRRRKIKEQNPDMKNTEVSRILGEMWRNASEEERRPHVEKEKKERDKYKVAISQWRKEYEAKKAEEQRRQNEAQQAQQQWAPPYSQDGVDSNTPPMQYSQQPYMNMPPPGYAPYPPQPYGYGMFHA